MSTNNYEGINLGDTVVWTSQAGGKTVAKKGKVVFLSHSNVMGTLSTLASSAHEELWASPVDRTDALRATKNQTRFDFGIRHIIVAVTELQRGDQIQKLTKPRYYAPRAPLTVMVKAEVEAAQ